MINFVNGLLHEPGGSGNTFNCPSFVATAGNHIILGISSYTATKRTVTSISDTAGNSYNRAGNEYSGDASHDMEFWLCENCKGHASNVVTVNFSGSADFRICHVLQYSGLKVSGSLDKESTGKLDGSTTTTHTSNSTGTTDKTNELILSMCVTWDAAYPYSVSSPINLRTSNGNYNSACYDKIVSATGDYTTVITTGTANKQAYFTKTFRAQEDSIFVLMQ